MPLSNTGVIFSKSDIEHPMQAVFNSPMTSDGIGKRVHGGETEQKVARFPADLVPQAPFSSNHANSSQVFPPLLRIQIRQDGRITDGPVLSDFQSPMPLFHTAVRLCLHVGKGLLLGQRKRRLDLFVQVSLVVFEGQSILALLLDDLLSDL